jgi:non-ribosomal peptide synthetase component F
MERVREVCLAAFSHQDLPFERLVHEVNPGRELDRNPLFQIMFGFIPQVSALRMKLAGLNVRALHLANHASPFDFSLYMTEGRAGFAGTARYRVDLYDAGTIGLFLHLFQTLLEHVLANPDLTLNELDPGLISRSRDFRAKAAHELRERRVHAFGAMVGGSSL